MRILNVTQSYAPFFEFGGPPVKVRALSRELAQRGHQVTVLTADWKLEERVLQMGYRPRERQARRLVGGRMKAACSRFICLPGCVIAR